MSRKLMGIGILIATMLGIAFAGPASPANAADPSTVTISGRAFVFNFMDTPITGATIKVREFPEISTTTNELGDYVLEVPNDANVTPYIVSGEGTLQRRNMDDTPKGSTRDVHWNEIDLQTFHPRGENIVNANFQTPRDEEYEVLGLMMKIPMAADGRPEQCAIVTTSSARDVRDTDYAGYWLNTPHGVEGATSVEYPAIDGPTYFNEQVLPDASQPHSSGDGGIIWPIVPTGTYRIVTSAPDAQFASFLVTCAPGRVINANPPWGAYELSPGEQPLAAGNVAANFVSAKVAKTGKRTRQARVNLTAGEAIKATALVKAGGKTLAKKTIDIPAGSTQVKMAIGPKVKTKKANVSVTLQDASGVSFTTVKKVTVPKVAKPKKPKKNKKNKKAGKGKKAGKKAKKN